MTPSYKLKEEVFLFTEEFGEYKIVKTKIKEIIINDKGVFYKVNGLNYDRKQSNISRTKRGLIKKISKQFNINN